MKKNLKINFYLLCLCSFTICFFTMGTRAAVSAPSLDPPLVSLSPSFMNSTVIILPSSSAPLLILIIRIFVSYRFIMIFFESTIEILDCSKSCLIVSVDDVSLLLWFSFFVSFYLRLLDASIFHKEILEV